ncbi:unnamed protein product [Gongylonema pulchrum]|uniref:ABC2_membrane_7 domain-containing protein n=1 Tax=Gongylonema pulchrum TaxID=637853 RepID=A0A183DTV2_9BILA|nr:unnamed protein product [Gongylonema pulchrum]
MNIVLDPKLSCEEELRFSRLNSFDFVDFWSKKGEPSDADKALLYKGIRILDNELVKAKEASEKDVTRIYTLYLKIGHISLLARDFPRGFTLGLIVYSCVIGFHFSALSAYQKAYNLNRDAFWSEPASYFGLGMPLIQLTVFLSSELTVFA